MTQDDQKICPVFPFVLRTESLKKRVLGLKGLLDKILQKLARNMQSSCFSAQKPGLFAPGCIPLPDLDGTILLSPFIHHTVLGLILLSWDL